MFTMQDGWGVIPVNNDQEKCINIPWENAWISQKIMSPQSGAVEGADMYVPGALRDSLESHR